MTDHRLEIVLAAKDITRKAFTSVGGHISRLEKQVFSLRGVMAGAAGAAGMGYLIKRTIDATAEIERNAQMAGVSAEAYQELAYAAGQYQVNADALTDGLKELSLRTDEYVQTAAGPAAEAFARLGYTQEELNRKLSDTPALLTDIVRRLEGVDRAAQIRIADEIFGGQGGEQFVAMIRGGASALDGLRGRARALGMVIDADLVRSSADAKKEIEALGMVLSTRFQATVAALAPDIADIAGDMADWVKENKTFLTQDIPGHISAIGTSLGEVKKTYDTLPDGVVGTAGVGIVGRLLFGSWKPAAALMIVKTLNDQMESISKNFNVNMPTFGSVVKNFRELNEIIAATMRGERWQPGSGASAGSTVPAAPSAPAVPVALPAITTTALPLKSPATAKPAKMPGLDLTPDDIAKAYGAMYGDLGLDAPGAYYFQISQLEAQRDQFVSITGDMATADAWFASEVEKVNDRIADSSATTANFMADAFNGAFDVIGNSLYDFLKSSERDLGGFMTAIADQFARMGIAGAFQGLNTGLFGAGGIGGAIAGLFGGARAAGGPVYPGMTYLVGERGPELFTPSGAGAIVPNDRLGAGGGTVNYMIYAIDSQSFQDALRKNSASINEVVQRNLKYNRSTRDVMRKVL